MTALGACGEYLLSLECDSCYVCFSVGEEAHCSGGLTEGAKDEKAVTDALTKDRIRRLFTQSAGNILDVPG